MKSRKTTKSQKRKAGSTDRLVKTRGAAKIDLTEEELQKVSGGTSSSLWAAQKAFKAT